MEQEAYFTLSVFVVVFIVAMLLGVYISYKRWQYNIRLDRLFRQSAVNALARQREADNKQRLWVLANSDVDPSRLYADWEEWVKRQNKE